MHEHAHLRHEIITCGVSNAFFNGIVAWLLLRTGPALGWAGKSSFMFDIVATAMLLPFIVALIVIPLQRRKLHARKLQSIDLGPDSVWQRFADRLPGSTFPAALSFAVMGLGVIAPATLLGFYILGIATVAPGTYAVFKGVWAGFMAAVLVIPMVLVALRNAPPELHRAAST